MIRAILVAAMTVDGSIGPMPLGSVQDRRLLQRLRAETDASIIGAGTARSDDPELALADGVLPEGRERIVVSSSGDIDTGKKLFRRGPKPVIVTDLRLAAELRRRLHGQAKVCGVPSAEGTLPVSGILHQLERLGIRSLLIEGGGRLNGSFLAADAVDELYVTMVPMLAVNASLPRIVTPPRRETALQLPLQLCSCRVEEGTGELFLRYRRTNG